MSKEPFFDSLPEVRFRLMFESIKDYALIMLDTEGRIVDWNPGAEQIKGYTRKEILGSHFSRFYPAEDLAAGKPERELEQAAAEGRVEDEGWRLRKDGSRFWANVVITALRDPESGELYGYGKVTKDLSERRAAEEQLRESEQQFRLLVERVEEYAIFMLDPTGHVATWNIGAQQTKGYAAEEIIGKSFECFYPPQDRAAGKPMRLLGVAKENGHVHEQGLRVRKDGSTFQADVLITAIRGADGKLRGFSKLTRDITDQLRNRATETARIAAEKANETKDKFLSMLSHELRTPLTPVLAAVGYLSENAGHLSFDERLEELAIIRRNVLLEAQLIDDLLDITRISQGKIELRYEAIDARTAIQQSIEICEESIHTKQLKLATEFYDGEHWIWADPVRIQQVFWNLLTNAVKFTPIGGSIHVRSTRGPRGKLLIGVTDSGIGIEKEAINRIFDAFEQGERTVTRKFGGLGLGLAITRNLLTMHGGEIVVLSDGRGKGATFSVTLPLVQHLPVQKKPAECIETPSTICYRILIVDDHDDTRRIFSRLLAKLGHHTVTADGVASGLALIASQKFDLLISDIGLQDGTGYELMAQAKAKQPDLRGIALSGFGTDEDRRLSAEAGFESHVNKPVDFAILRELLRGRSK